MNRLILNKATSSNDEPTPGYLYNEISQIAFCSKDSLNFVGEYLIKKLQRTDLNVKLKTLKILKHLCDKKRSDFRIFLKKKIDLIKECQNCNIVHDELKGDTPSMLVRKEATDLIKVIYSYDGADNNVKNSVSNSQDMMKNNRIEGFGNSVFEKYNNGVSNSYTSPTSASANSMEYNLNANNSTMNKFNNRNNYMSKMLGFGNPYFNQNPVQKTKGEIAMKYLNEVANKYIPSSFVNKINKVSASISKNYANGSLNIQSIMNGNAFSRNFEKSYMRRKDNFNSYGGNCSGNYGGGGYIGTCHPNFNKMEKARKPQESQASGIYEAKIIDDVLMTTGINKVPCENLLNEFSQKCETLDTKVIVSILTSKLKSKFTDEEETWKYKFKVLCVIRHLLIHRKKKGNEKVIETLDFLIQDLKNQTLEELYKCKEIKQLKKHVIEIFVLMGLQQKPSTEKESVKKEFKKTVEIPNLLDIDDEFPLPSNKHDTNSAMRGGGMTDRISIRNSDTNNNNYNNNHSSSTVPSRSNININNFSPNNNMNSFDLFHHDTKDIKQNCQESIRKKKYNENKDYHNDDFLMNSQTDNNNELFSSLNVKNLSQMNINMSNKNGDTKYRNMSTSKNEERDYISQTTNSIVNAPTKIKKNCNNNLIFLDNKNNDYNQKGGQTNTLSYNQSNLNDDDNILSFENDNIKHPYKSNNNQINFLWENMQSASTHINDLSHLNIGNPDKSVANNYDHINKKCELSNHSNNDINALISGDKERHPFDKKNLQNIENSKYNNDFSLIDINENICSGTRRTFDNADMDGNMHNLKNESYIDGATNYRNHNNASAISNNKSKYNTNKVSDSFENSLNNSMKIDDDQINNFFTSFTITSTKTEESNTKPNVKLDAFELLADQLKL
ncbi:hypothetical protein MKS88_004492 [Plasmodium brasilianum]|uniref:Uncharacterized protein n=1 Tax=Plasmodium brasilianum TaxID=5824 RepID=A0ACB9Y6A2_PLABR|nr:hypothetical protein MKS88_004492 [Plasmodium brasilianum]